MTREQELLKSAMYEIRTLRRQNEILSAKQEVFDSMMQVLNTSAATKNIGMSPDLAWEIERYLDIQSEKVAVQ